MNVQCQIHADQMKYVKILEDHTAVKEQRVALLDTRGSMAGVKVNNKKYQKHS